MNQSERILGIMTNEVKKQICEQNVITPEIFANIFLQVAKEHDVEYENVAKQYMNEEVKKYLELQDKTTNAVNKLSESTSSAIDAIEKKDDGTLKVVLKDTKKLQQELERLKKMLYTDELTDVYNRKWLFDNLAGKDDHLFKEKGVMALIDLNYFKQVNDTYGHIIGDKVLVFIAAQLRKAKGEVVRYGGDEFMVFFNAQEDTDDIRKRLEKLRESILKKHLKAKNAEFRVSFSIGVTKYLEKETVEDVIERADNDMYEDKKTIKKRITGIHV